MNERASYSNLETKETFIKKTFSWLVYKGDDYLGSCTRPERWFFNKTYKDYIRHEPRPNHVFYGKKIQGRS